MGKLRQAGLAAGVILMAGAWLVGPWIVERAAPIPDLMAAARQAGGQDSRLSVVEEAAALQRALQGAAARPPARMQRSVFVISLPTGQSDPGYLLQKSRDLADLLREASAPHGYRDPEAVPALAFEIYRDQVLLEAELPPYRGAGRDLGLLFEKHGLCDLVRRGEIDEVWFWEGGTGGLPEWATNGPEWQSLQNTNMPDCGRQVALMALHNGLDLGFALHSFGHRMESTMRVYFPCDFSSRTWPWPARAAGCREETASDATGYVARAFAGNGRVAACGDVHWPPNISSTGREYDYWNETPVDSICQDWQRDGTAEVERIDCRSWDCTQTGYMLWWFQNMPGADGGRRGLDGQPLPAWWPYLFGRPENAPTRAPQPSLTPGPTPSPTPTMRPSPTPSPTRGPTATEVGRRSWLPLALYRATPLPALTAVASSSPMPSLTPAPLHVAYVVPDGTIGNQVHYGGLGMDFDVIVPVELTHLGAFDSLQDGLRSKVFVYLVDRRSEVVLAEVELWGEAGTRIEGSRFLELDSPLRLPAGFEGSVVAEGYSQEEPNGNSLGEPPAWSLDDGGGLLRFVGSSRYSWQPTLGGLPRLLDGGPRNRYAAGSFRFRASAPRQEATVDR